MLSFNDLASNSATGVTPYGKVLTVTSSGDVVLVNDDNSSEKISTLENEVAQLKKDLAELKQQIIASKN